MSRIIGSILCATSDDVLRNHLWGASVPPEADEPEEEEDEDDEDEDDEDEDDEEDEDDDDDDEGTA